MLKNKKIMIIIGVAVILVAAIFMVFKNQTKKPDYRTVRVEKKDLRQQVNVTGRVKSAESVDLAFERGGKVAEVWTKVNSTVEKGQLLVRLENADLSAQYRQAEATLENTRAAAEQAKATLQREKVRLAELKAGTRSEELEISRTRVRTAEVALADAQKSLNDTKSKAESDMQHLYEQSENVIQAAYASADDSVNKYLDELFINDYSSYPTLSFSASDNTVAGIAETNRAAANAIVNELRQLSQNVPKTLSERDAALAVVENSLRSLWNLFPSFTNAVSSASSLSLADSASYKTSVASGRSIVTTAISTVSAARQGIMTQRLTNDKVISTAVATVNSSEQALVLAQNQLRLAEAGATADQISAQEAVVRQAEAAIAAQDAQLKYSRANLDQIGATLDKTYLRAPLRGVVTKQEAKVGEIVSPNALVLSLESPDAYDVESFVPEADIVKIQKNQAAMMTLDAYGNNLAFPGIIATIDPAETILEGVSTYKVVLQFTTEDERVKSGMTANININSAERIGVLAIPARAIIFVDKKAMVKKVLPDGSIAEIEIVAGLKGSNGDVEVLSGLIEGDMVLISE